MVFSYLFGKLSYLHDFRHLSFSPPWRSKYKVPVDNRHSHILSLPSWDYLWQARDESGQAKVDEDIVDEQRQGHFKWQSDPALSIDRQIHALSTLLVTSTITQ